PFNSRDSLSRDDLSLSASQIPFRAMICSFQQQGFPFARHSVPFKHGDSLSRDDFSLSMSQIPFRATICPFRRASPFQQLIQSKKESSE
ncbi:hypothetical protein AB0X74_07520, partial [Kurthia gibsonii]|uniref:hypothetical protein n=1 Tax=Kurthia gibsonii TaxID=33946 RepID=UPI003F23E016